MSPKEKYLEEKLEPIMLGITLLLIPIVLIPLLYELPQWLVYTFYGLDIFIWIAFIAELVMKFIVSTNYYATLKRNWFLVVILLMPLFLSFRLIRLARFASLLRLLRIQGIVDNLKQNARELAYNIEYATIGIFLFVSLAAFIMWRIELMWNGSITNFGDALWWAIITITTIGYGDIIPSSPPGKVFGAIVSFMGIVIFMVVVARITSMFVTDDRTRALDKAIRFVNRQKREKER